MTFDKIVERIIESENITEIPEGILLGNVKYPKDFMVDVVEQKTGRRPKYPGETIMGVKRIKKFYETLREPQRPYQGKTKPEVDYRKFD